MNLFESLFDAFGNVRIGVIGDVMLDSYYWGHVERISPEAPVPVVDVRTREHRIGGAGNVALNLASLGAQAAMLSVIGCDAEGSMLRKMFEEKNIGASYLLEREERMTTHKTRVIARNQQMLRLDSEITEPITQEMEAALLQQVQRFIDTEKPQALIFEDYDKGVLTENLISQVVGLCATRGVMTAVDPKRRNFLAYRGVDIYKPNLKEIREGLGIVVDAEDKSSLERAHHLLSEKLGHRISLVTLSEHGVFYAAGDVSGTIPSFKRKISDVSGAGDTVIAVATLAYAVTRDLELAAQMANLAGGIVCEEVGTAAISKARFMEECQRLLGGGWVS